MAAGQGLSDPTSNHFQVTCYFRFGVKLLSILILPKITGFSPYLTMPPKKKLRVIDTNQRKITSMLQQGPELTQDAPASADSESAEPENPSEMPEPLDVDMTETDVSDGSSEIRKFQLHWLQLHKWLKFDSKLNKMY